MLFFLKYIGGKVLGAVKWLITNWRISLIGIAVLIVFVATFTICGRLKKKPTINLDKVTTINNAAQKERREELRNIVIENQDTVKTVREDIAIQDVNVVEKNAEIDAKVKAIDQKIMDGKSQGHDVTQEELECLLVPGSCK